MNTASGRLDKIVIVDDDARIRDLLRRFLSQEGFDVLLAEDARALSRIMQREHVDLLVLDLMLPARTVWRSAAACAPRARRCRSSC